MRLLAKGALVAGLVGAVALLLIVTKPGPKRSTPSPAGSVRAEPHRAVTASNHGVTATPVAVSSAATGPSRSADPPVIGSSWQEHGRTAVVRSTAAAGAAKGGLHPLLAAARWQQPTALKFFGLKKHYRAYRKRSAFDPELLQRLSGAAVTMTGAFMPIDPIPDDGKVKRFWLANPLVVMAGCVFCTPPTLADLVYVTTGEQPMDIDREKLFTSVVMLELLGRLRLGPQTTTDGVQYLYGMELRRRLD